MLIQLENMKDKHVHLLDSIGVQHVSPFTYKAKSAFHTNGGPHKYEWGQHFNNRGNHPYELIKAQPVPQQDGIHVWTIIKVQLQSTI